MLGWVGEMAAVLRVVPSIDGAVTTMDASAGRRIRESVFYEFSGGLAPHPAGIGNAALLAFLPYAMRRGLDIHIAAAVDSDLLVKLEEAQDAWALWHPALFRPVGLAADEIRQTAPPQADTAAMAFSGGMDATYALHVHRRRLIGRRALDVRAAVMIHGFDLPLEQNDWFAAAKRRAATILAAYDVPMTAVRTNWRSLELPWEATHIFGLASVLHQLKGRVAHGIIAADEPYDGEILGWGSNSVTNQMMSGASFPIQFTGAGKRRTEKARALRDEPAAYRNLRVCWEQPTVAGNCGSCEKCVRTKLNLLAAGISDTSAFGTPVSSDEIRAIPVRNTVAMNFFRELSAYPWPDHPEIKAALDDLVTGGLRRDKSIRKRLSKYRRSLQKRGLWPK